MKQKSNVAMKSGMAVRSLNKVQLIGNLTRDPELRYTPQGTAVCSLGLATNRTWTTDTGDKREETEFHRIVAWAKLAELCSQLLFKGRRIYVEGRLQTRQWTAQDGSPRSTTEVVIDDMIILDSKHESRRGSHGDDRYGSDDGYDYDKDQSDQADYGTAYQGDDSGDDQTVSDDSVDEKESVDSEEEEKKSQQGTTKKVKEDKKDDKEGNGEVKENENEKSDIPF